MISVHRLFEFDADQVVNGENGIADQAFKAAQKNFNGQNPGFWNTAKSWFGSNNPEQARINMRNANMTTTDMENMKRGYVLSQNMNAPAVDPKTGMALNTQQQLGVGARAAGNVISSGTKTVGNFIQNNPSVAAAAGVGAGAMYLANRNKRPM